MGGSIVPAKGSSVDCITSDRSSFVVTAGDDPIAESVVITGSDVIPDGPLYEYFM